MTDQRPTTSLKPYLTLPQLFSLSWLAYPVISLLFVAFRLQISSADAQNAVSDAKGTLLTSCKAAETAAASAASLPRILAQGTNDQIVDAVNGTLNGARAALILSLTIMEAIIEFIVDMYRSTFLCFLELVVRGGLSLLISASEEITNFLNSTLSGISSALKSEVNAANSAINGAISAINKVGSIFGGNINIPSVSLGSLDQLDNIKIPNDFTNALVSLNNTLPTLDELRDAIDKVIETPFELLKKDINETFSAIHFDTSVLPVPQRNTLSFCQDMDTSVVDRLGVDLLQVTKIATILCIVLALMLIAANCLLEWYKYRCMLNGLERTRQAWVSDRLVEHSGNGTPVVALTNENLRDLMAKSQHPLLYQIVQWFENKMGWSNKPNAVVNVRWFFAYVFHPPALACLLIGLFGLISVELQIAALGPIAHRYEGEVANTVSDFTSLIATSINTSMQNDSMAYATAVNGQVDGIQTTINDGMFGWVNGTTSTLNDTLVTFYAEVQNAVETVFGGTPLEGPVQEFVRCLLGTKVDAFEHALTFLHDNLHVDVPRVNDNVLMLNNATVDEVTRPISLAAVGDQGEGSDGGLVGRLITRYVASLKKERIMFLVFLGLWGFVVLMALGVILWHSVLRDSMACIRERRGKKRWEQEQRGFDPATIASPEERASTRFDSVKLGYSDAKRQRSKSWDSDDMVEKSVLPSPTKSRKLIAFGRRARRGEQLVPDGYDHDSPRVSTSEQTPGLWTRLVGLFRRPQQDEPDWIAGHSPSSSRVHLTLDTQAPARAEVPRHTWIPPHEWSLNPRASFSPKRPSPPPKIMSTSVTGVEQMRFPAPPQTTPYPVPHHHHFARQVPSDMPRSPTDFLTHSRGSSLPTSPPPPPPPPPRNMAGIGAMSGSPPDGRFLTVNQHARKSSQNIDPGLNPFATLFDEPSASPFADSNAAAPPPARNPFMTGRAF